jgi:RNA recognition motif-containing protein
MRDPDTGVSKGFGFISFDCFEAADAAIEAMNGQFLCGRAIAVSYAYKKESKGEGGAGGGWTARVCGCWTFDRVVRVTQQSFSCWQSVILSSNSTDPSPRHDRGAPRHAGGAPAGRPEARQDGRPEPPPHALRHGAAPAAAAAPGRRRRAGDGVPRGRADGAARHAAGHAAARDGEHRGVRLVCGVGWQPFCHRAAAQE